MQPQFSQLSTDLRCCSRRRPEAALASIGFVILIVINWIMKIFPRVGGFLLGLNGGAARVFRKQDGSLVFAIATKLVLGSIVAQLEMIWLVSFRHEVVGVLLNVVSNGKEISLGEGSIWICALISFLSVHQMRFYDGSNSYISIVVFLTVLGY